MRDQADICLIIEGAYPFVTGGVSAWTHALLHAQRHLRFALVAITPDETPRRLAYRMPANVVSFDVLQLHMPTPSRTPIKGALCEELLHATLAFQRDGRLDQLDRVSHLLAPYIGHKTPADFLDSEQLWQAMERIANEEMPECSFLHFFWSTRSLLSAFLSTMLAPLPRARAYHTISTGYAGILAARASMEFGRPALLTEHGIYTNERRIEIASADWLHERSSLGVTLDTSRRTLKDLWTDCFSAYARATYAAVECIVTLFQGNQEMQIRDGAPPEKCMIVPNGIDCQAFGRVGRPENDHPPTVALIGRVVPIKDIKTFLHAIAMLKDKIPGLNAMIIGPTDENEAYYRQCVAITHELKLDSMVCFTGKVTLTDYLSRIHLNVLTSLSEAQPLVILEVGAAGIPSIASDVGACREMILGMPDEVPALGPGGAVVPIGDAYGTAQAIAHFLLHRDELQKAADAARKRVNRYYSKTRMDLSYRRLYDALLAHGARPATAPRQSHPKPQRTTRGEKLWPA